MAASSHRLHLARFAGAVVCALLAACSSTETLASPGTCVEGQTQECSCSDGQTGVRECERNNEYGVCICGAPTSGGSGGSGGVAGVAGNPVGGSGGFAAIGGMNAMAGTTGGSAGAAGITGGSGGFAATGGTNAMAGTTGGSAGAAGVTGGSGGESGSGGASGMDGSGGEGGMSGPGRDPEPGELYGECLANGGCDDGLLCVNDSSAGSADSYCTTTCDALSPMSCPRARGDGMVVCILGICVR